VPGSLGRETPSWFTGPPPRGWQRIGGAVTNLYTFLFTDLEGSTRLWEAHPEAMHDVLRRHDDILRAAVAEHGGTVVKHTGDGIHAVLASATDGVRAAVAAQRRLQAEPWGLDDTFRVRMGLHAGTATPRDGDFFGPSVNRAARVMSAANGGQILASEMVTRVVGAVDAGAVGFVDLGRHRLRDLAQAETLYQVSAPGLLADFPPLRSLDDVPGNLPTQLTSFLGRGRELEGLAELSARHRLVTLVGVGGVGKTRLALQHAAACSAATPDGTWFCELGTVRDPDDVTQVVSVTLGASSGSQLEPADAVVELLRAKEALVVLDNCEHVLDAAAAMTRRLLGECPRLRIVATSREALGVDGEQQLPVRPLPVTPARIDEPDGSAVDLFVERARAVRPDFELTDDNRATIVEVCARLDGLPLALELAAGRTAAFTPAQIAGMLDQRFRLLAARRHGGVDRHQTLEATIDWSFSELSEMEQALFARLGVFTGGFDVAAATAVTSDDTLDEFDVLDGLAGLVATSMITTELGDDESMRYVLLESLRDFARARLDADGSLVVWSRRHARYCSDRAQFLGRIMMGPDEVRWRSRMLEELGNLRAAVTWALDVADPADQELAAEIIAPLSHQSVMSPVTGIGDWAADVLERNVAMRPAGRFGVEAAACYFAMRRGDYARQQVLAARCLAGGALPVAHFPHMPFVALATWYALAGRPEDCRRVFDDGAEALEQLGASGYDQSILLGARGMVEAAYGLPTARTYSESALRLARETGNPSCLVGALFALGVSILGDDRGRALSLLDEGITLALAGSNASFVGRALGIAAQLRADRGEYELALARVDECVRHFDNDPDQPAFVTSLILSVPVLAACGHEALAALIGGAVQGPYAALSQATSSDLLTMHAALDAVQGSLGEGEYDASAARGAGLSLDELQAALLTGLGGG
jgi:predicted ATPase/class 3 adenylate cyclase